MTQASPLVLVDGSSYLYRAFHALPPLTGPSGQPTGAVYGVVGMLHRLRQDYRPTRMVVVFDAPGGSFRNQLYADYKAHRPPMPDELVQQVEPLHQLVRALGIPLLSVPEVEADDVIATLTAAAVERGEEVIISTGDKDLAQLVGPGVTLVNTMTGTVLDREGVIAKFGVAPEQIVDYLTLVGDSVDNVPGVAKVGPKTAAKWLAEYGSLDQIMAQAEQVGGKIGANLRAALPHLPLSRQLVTVRRDLELGTAGTALELQDPDRDQLARIYRQLGFRRWLDALGSLSPEAAESGTTAGPVNANTDTDAAAVGEGQASAHRHPYSHSQSSSESNADAVPGAATGAVPNAILATSSGQAVGADLPLISAGMSAGMGAGTSGGMGTGALRRSDASNYQILRDQAALDAFCTRLLATRLVAFDTETSSLDYMQAQLVGLAFALMPGEAWYLPLAHSGADAEPQLPQAAVLAQLRPWLESEQHGKVGHHLKYDRNVLGNYGINLRGIVDDTMLESYVLDAGAHRHDLDTLAEKYLQLQTVHYEDIAGRGAKQIPLAQVPVAVAAHYAAEDADVCLRLHRYFVPRLEQEPRLAAIYRDLEIPLIPILSDIERTGVCVDADLLRAQSEDLAERLDQVAEAAYAEAGVRFNLGSPKQIQEILFNRLKLEPLRRTPKGQPSTAEDVLEQMAHEHPLPALILEHRGLAKLRSTYTERLPERIDPQTGRVHTSYHQAVAATGRLSSSDPNLQNIPVRTEAGRKIRQAFIAPPGQILLAADYSQIELRIMAHLSDDSGLLAAFAAGQDIHRATAAEVFGLTPDAVTSEQRRAAKAINFGLIYGMSAFGLARNLGIEQSAAKQYIERYFQRYPGVQTYMETTRERARACGYVETLFGRRLYLPEIKSRNAARRAQAERVAINAPMQGTAADIIKRAMLAVAAALQRQRLPARMIMQVHDELVLEVQQGAEAEVGAQVAAAMAGAADLKVELVVDVGTGSNWDAAH